MKFLKKVIELHNLHKSNCKEYKKIIETIFLKKKISSLEDLPFIPVNIFKSLNLMSVEKKKIYKIMRSSGTSGQNSKIFLDKTNAKTQIKALTQIFNNHVSGKRLPMFILGKNPVKNLGKEFDAQTAAILGFSIFSTKNYYLLNDNGELNIDILKKFLQKNKNQKFYIFGFTFNIYKFLLTKKINLNLKNSILLHGGGWKKMESLKINNKKFKLLLKKNYKISRVINYYGLVEQTGSIFFECEKCSRFVTSNFNDIIIRDQNFQIKKNNTKGIIQLLSTLPTSYPGHSILTEDVGEICGISDCNCGRKGKYFRVHGRIEKSEIRGCSNV